MFGIGMPELLVLLVIGLLVFGSKRLPEIGSGLGKAIRGFHVSVREDPVKSPAAEQAGVCGQCGQPVLTEANFCRRCGNRLRPA